MANPRIFAPTFHGDVVAVAKLLEEDRTLVRIRDAKNLTPLHVAASRGQSEVAQLLLDFGADVQGPSETDQWTPVVFAAYRGHFAVTEVLIKNGAGVTAEHGNPIHYAGQRKHKDICRLLVEHGAIDPLVDSDDSDVLHLFRAAYSYDADSVREILTRRPELVKCKDRDGRTALHEACTNGDNRTVRELLRFGSDVTAEDQNGETPADRAAAHRQRAVLKLLQKQSGDGSQSG